MKNINVLKTMFMLLSMILLSEKGFALLIKCNTKDSLPKQSKTVGEVLHNKRLSAPRTFIPYSLQGRVSNRTKTMTYQKNSSTVCPEDSLCASFDTNITLKNVFSWMGFNFEDTTGNYFVATYGPEAIHLGNNVYATKKWDKRLFWINIGEKTVPFPIQPRFVGVDIESGREWYVVDYFGYQKQGIDYSNYWENISASSLVLLVNPLTKEVENYYLEYYDENDEYVEDYTISIGDKVQSYFLAFKKGAEDADYLLSIEDITTVTGKITFDYKEQYPAKDFNCTYCGDLDLSKVQFKYIFESFTETRSNYTEPQSIKNISTSNDLSSSSKKSIPISGSWTLFILLMGIAMLTLRNDYKLHKA